MPKPWDSGCWRPLYGGTTWGPKPQCTVANSEWPSPDLQHSPSSSLSLKLHPFSDVLQDTNILDNVREGWQVSQWHSQALVLFLSVLEGKSADQWPTQNCRHGHWHGGHAIPMSPWESRQEHLSHDKINLDLWENN